MRKQAKPEETRRSSERERVRQLASLSASKRFPQLALGIGDDAALLRLPPGQQIVVSTDFTLEGVHFRREWHTAESAGHRCLARGLSDLAAMGARPVAAFLSLALPRELAGAWADGFFAGLLALANEYKIPLAGGDLASSEAAGSQRAGAKVLADIVLLGSVPAGRALLRSSARPGDLLYVTGMLGGSAADLASIPKKQRSPQHAARTKAPQPHFFPEPRIACGMALSKLGQRIACLDISDGLALDLARLCEASKVSAEIDETRLPLAAGATLQQTLTGGEDYELLFTVPPELRLPKKLGGVAATRIGRITSVRRGHPQMALIQADGKRLALASAGWEYFK